MPLRKSRSPPSAETEYNDTEKAAENAADSKSAVMNTDPPAYAAGTAVHRSIHDLRTQIIANGSVIRPRGNNHRSSDDHIELVVAKTSPTTRSPFYAGGKQAQAAAESGNNAVAGSSTAGKHYAVLLLRSYVSQDVKIIVSGEPRDTVEEALEWMLERTEVMVHQLVVKYGRPDKDTECSVM